MKVLIKAPLSIFTGYGNDGIGLAEAFIRMGADVVLQPTHVQAPLPKEVAELLAKPVEAPFDLTIHHVDPGALNSSETLKESSGAFIGWSMWEYCVDEATEIFTQRGWLRWNEVRVGDSSLAIDPETGKSSWQEISEIYIGPEMRRMLPLVPLGGDGGVLTTGNHRWLVNDNKGNFRWTTTDTMKTGHGVPRSAFRGDLPKTSTNSDEIVELVAWAYTEGWLERGLSLRIGQSSKVNPQKTDRIRLALESEFGQNAKRNSPAGGISWSESPREDGMVVFSLSREASLKILQLAPEKVPSKEFLLSLTEDQLDLFLSVSILADGWVRADGLFAFAQNVGERLEAFEFAATLAGRTLSKRYGDEKHVSVSISDPGRKFMPRSSSKQEFEMQEYVGRVWCPTLTHHNWLARRNGRIFFTGNTNLLNHGKQDTFKEKWKHYDMVIGYDDVSVGAFKEYFDGPTPKLQGGYNPENWPVAERDWFEDNFYFCMLGSLTVRKDPYLAIAAFTQLQNEHEDFKKYARLSLKTTPQNSMPPQIEDVYEGIRIYTDMWQNDLVWKFYESQHVLLAPSRGEGKNVPALEFMTTGGAVIATDWGGHKEWLNPDYSYPLDYTLEVSDYDEPDTECAKASLEHLKEQMLHVFRNRGDAKQKGQLASQIIPRLCAWDSVVDRLMNVLRDEHPNGEELWMKAFVSRQEYGNGTS